MMNDGRRMRDHDRPDHHREHHQQRHHDHHQHHQRRPPQAPPPKEGEIYQGEIVKIESYGAFCALLETKYQGLIHISQLYDSRVEKVDDVVSLNDVVWVKVLEVEQQQQQQKTDDTDDNRRPPRLRIKLSMKDVSQDGTRQDLGRQREQVEHAKAQLETNLNSMIGMGVARDPMENRLMFKGNTGKGTGGATNAAATFRGGYTLVGDDEGEIELPVDPTTKSVGGNDNNTNPGSKLQSAPMGRGRGATLPAWMTANSDGPTGISSTDKKRPRDTKDDISSSDQSSDDGDRKKKKRKREKSSSRKDHKRHSKKDKKKRKKRHDKRKRYDDDDDGTDESSGSSHHDTKHERRRNKRKKEKDRHDRDHRRHKRKKDHHDNDSKGGSDESVSSSSTKSNDDRKTRRVRD